MLAMLDKTAGFGEPKAGGSVAGFLRGVRSRSAIVPVGSGPDD